MYTAESNADTIEVCYNLQLRMHLFKKELTQRKNIYLANGLLLAAKSAFQ